MLLLTDQLRSEYNSLFDSCVCNADKQDELTGIMNTIGQNQARYAAVSAALSNIPWYVIAAIHNLEASLDFSTHLHNGDPLTARTVHVPAGRPPTGNPPFTWEESAEDALRLDGFDHWTDWTVSGIAYKLERYNGTGYRAHGINSPYLWGGSNLYFSGKYTADNVYSAYAVSQQIGGMVLLKAMEDAGMIGEIAEEVAAADAAAPVAAPVAPVVDPAVPVVDPASAAASA